MSSEFMQRGRTLRRGKTLNRPERFLVAEPMLDGQGERLDSWVIFSRVVTFWAPSFILKSVVSPTPMSFRRGGRS
ncbi:hypothetical protein DSO57_1038751 [Entomophthora muscae]|uniref:Uncharacterized protein n=1 Tax=Entomophthora muscae TaxID=34485 RepID=A0ACC2SMZ9_9FUNG|nr:hypothetical protein DSO57_1038751 [Entomophthora muscae]